MLDDIFDLVSDLVGENTVNQLTSRKRPAQTPARTTPKPKTAARRQTPPASGGQTKLTARRDRRGGEDPWDWKEEKPPWEF